MKKIFYLSIVLTLFLFSCDSRPQAQFHTDTVQPSVGHEVWFTNDSHNAKRFEWDFGDGFISNEENPIHVYTGTGSYEVFLTATSKNGTSDKASLTLDVMIPTLLEIEVREYYSEDLIPDASVILYPSITDWDAETNVISEGVTDAGGIVVFSDLDPFAVYVDVYEATHDNYVLRNEDYLTYIRTPDVLPHKINRFIAWVDIADHSGAKGTGARNFVMKNPERKVTFKRQPAPDSNTDNWQLLYDRSIKKK